MFDLSSKEALVVGGANDQRIAWGCGQGERAAAIELADYVVGSYDEMAPRRNATLQSIRSILDLPPPKQCPLSALARHFEANRYGRILRSS